MHKRALIATVIATAFMARTAMAAAPRTAEPPRPAVAPAPVGLSNLPKRPDKVDWQKIKAAARMRSLALAPHRTARFRSFAGYLGLSALSSLRPLANGPCLIAVTYLRNNLLDLENAFPGENWDPLRRAVAKEPSIQVCAPRPARHNQDDRVAPAVRLIVARAITVA